jgi:hypothetical protein
VNTGIANVAIANFISSGSTALCGSLTYLATNSDGTAIDSSVFTFTSTPGSLNIAISTTNTLKVGSYTIKVNG